MKLLKTVLRILGIGLCTTAIYGTLELASEEWANGAVCPKVVGVPACYFVLVGYTLLLLSWLVNSKMMWMMLFRSGAVICLGLALYGSVKQYFGYLDCPVSNAGLPLCYLSLFFASAIILIKAFYHRKGIGRDGL